MSTRRSLLASLILAGLSATALPACAVGSLVDVQIVDRTQDHLLDAYRYRGATYVAGQPGNRYAVRMTNRTGARVLVVLSVDGVNAVSGETAAVGQTGYVIGPWGSTEITGWRKSNTEAAAFYFTALADSYAARTDRPDNVGVIGAAVFRERVFRAESRGYSSDASPVLRKDAPSAADGAGNTERPRAAAEPTARANAAPDASTQGEASAKAALGTASPTAPSRTAEDRESADFSATRRLADRLGTGHGEREYSPITQVAFERASSQPADVVRLRYDRYSNLVAMGVFGSRVEPIEPQAFSRFVPDPR